jgi:glycine cleavage system aminomethyltransferase T
MPWDAQASPAQAEAFDPILRSPVHRQHRDLGGRFVREGGWELPAAYGDPGREEEALDGAVGIGDITARAKVDLRGGLDPWLGRLTGGIAPRGGLATESSLEPRLIVAAISNRWALILSEPAPSPPSLDHSAAVEEALLVTDASSMYAGFALAGPRTTDLVARLSSVDRREIQPGACLATRMAEVSAILVSRQLETTIVEAYVTSEYARYFWETLLEAGRDLGAAALGWDALRAGGWW